MNKSQLVDAVSERSGLSKLNAKKCIDAFVDIASETLRSGEKLTMTGFGTFIVTRRPARLGRNFRTGTPVDIPETTAVKFRQSFETK